MGKWESSGKEGKKTWVGLASTGTFYSKDSPALSRERRRQGKEQETELFKVPSSVELRQLQQGGWTLETEGHLILPH